MIDLPDAVEQIAVVRQVCHTRAFRKAMGALTRHMGPATADCVYRVIVRRETVADVSRALNERMAALGRQDRYTVDMVRSMVLQALPVIYGAWYRRFRMEKERRS
jgi:copper oxidase (laccase) domain-containing protein